MGTPKLVPTTTEIVVDVDGSDLRSELALSRRVEVSIEQSEFRTDFWGAWQTLYAVLIKS
jgi:hypothetical protein